MSEPDPCLYCSSRTAVIYHYPGMICPRKPGVELIREGKCLIVDIDENPLVINPVEVELTFLQAMTSMQKQASYFEVLIAGINLCIGDEVRVTEYDGQCWSYLIEKYEDCVPIAEHPKIVIHK